MDFNVVNFPGQWRTASPRDDHQPDLGHLFTYLIVNYFMIIARVAASANRNKVWSQLLHPSFPRIDSFQEKSVCNVSMLNNYEKYSIQRNILYDYYLAAGR